MSERGETPGSPTSPLLLAVHGSNASLASRPANPDSGRRATFTFSRMTGGDVDV
jgi:hypothetical protein